MQDGNNLSDTETVCLHRYIFCKYTQKNGGNRTFNEKEYSLQGRMIIETPPPTTIARIPPIVRWRKAALKTNLFLPNNFLFSYSFYFFVHLHSLSQNTGASAPQRMRSLSWCLGTLTVQ
jgi:hypothetical protein